MAQASGTAVEENTQPRFQARKMISFESVIVHVQHPSASTNPASKICLAPIVNASPRAKSAIVDHLRAQADYVYEPEYGLHAFALDSLPTVFNFLKDRGVTIDSVAIVDDRR